MSIREVIERPPEREPKRNRIQEVMENIATREAENKAQELEGLSLDRKVEEERLKLNEIRQRSKEFREPMADNTKPSINIFAPEIVTMLAKANTEEEKQSILNAVAQLKTMDRLDPNTNAILMQMIQKQNPTATKNDSVELMKMFNESMRTVISMQPKQTDPLQVVSSIFQIMQNQQQQQLPQQQGFLDKLLDPDTFGKLKNLGLFGNNQPTTTDPAILFEIEKLRTERELSQKKMEREDARWLEDKRLEAESEKLKYGLIESALSGPLGKTLQALGGAGASKITGTPPAKQSKPVPTDVECPNCHRVFYCPTDAKTIICPMCGISLTLKEDAQPATADQPQPTVSAPPA